MKKKNLLQIEIIEEKKALEEENIVDEANLMNNNTLQSKENSSPVPKKDEKDVSLKKEEKKSVLKDSKHDMKKEDLKKEDKKEESNKKKVEVATPNLKKEDTKKEDKKENIGKKLEIKKEDSKKDDKLNLLKDSKKPLNSQKTIQSHSIYNFNRENQIFEEELSGIEEDEDDKPKYLNVEYETYNEFPPVGYVINNYDQYLIEKNVIIV
jgi:hypothetical protein